MPIISAETKEFNWTLASLITEQLFDDIENKKGDVGEENENKLPDIISSGLSAAELCSEKGRLLEKINSYHGAHLNALKLVNEYAELGSVMKGTSALVS